MGIEIITPRRAASLAVRMLGLDSDAVDIGSTEVLAASIRRAASLLCPTSPSTLVRAVDEALSGLEGHTDETRAALEATLDALVACGDLLELAIQDENNRRQIFLGPPAFVERASGACLLLGVRADGAPLLSDALMTRVECEGHVRLLPHDREAMADRLADEGLIELKPEQWFQAPRPQPAYEHLADYEARIAAAGDSGIIEGVRLIDPAQPPTYYRGRWRQPRKTDTGLFVARRPQGYGAELWCVVEIVDGDVRRGIDLPVGFEIAPGADDAWRLQAAMDSVNGSPQRFAVRPAGQAGVSVLDLFSPIPSWAQRRLDVIGTPIVRSRGALFSYAVPSTEILEELAFLQEMMWMIERNEGEA